MWWWRKWAELLLLQRSSVKQTVRPSRHILRPEHGGTGMKCTCLYCLAESTEDLCLGCPTLLPLNDTTALNFVLDSLVTVNNRTKNITYSLLEVGRMSSQVSLRLTCSVWVSTHVSAVASSTAVLMFQIVSGGPTYIAEYIITEANCTETCSPLLDASAVSIKEILTNTFPPPPSEFWKCW